MTTKKRNALYWVFKVASVLISCVFPVVAICERFPVWIETHGTGRSISTGGILIAIVLLVIFRKTVFSAIKERMKLKHTPPIVGWIVMLVASYAILHVCQFLADIIMVFWMGFFGCGLGTILSMVAEFCFRKEKGDEGT